MRSASSKRLYPGSALAKRNASLRAAAQLAALQAHDPLYETLVYTRRINPDRVTMLADLCALDDASGGQIDAGRVPHLLREDILNPGELNTVEIYDTATAGVGRDGRVDVELPRGNARLPGTTLVYWK